MLDEEYHVDFSFDPVGMSMMWPGPIGAKPVVTFFLPDLVVADQKLSFFVFGCGHHDHVTENFLVKFLKLN